VSCAKIKSETFKRMGARKATWKCDGCKTEGSSSSQSLDKSLEEASGSAVILDALKDMRDEMKSSFQSVHVKLEKVNSDIEDFKTEINAIKTEISGIQTCNAVIEDKIGTLQAENDKFKQENLTLRETVQRLDQYSRVDNLLISGIPVTPGENIYVILANIAEVLNIAYSNSDVSVAHRLRAKPNDSRPPAIVVKFVAREIKNLWLAAKRKKRTFSTTELRGRLDQADIYFNEHLTPHTSAIFYRARQLVKSRTINRTWTRDCQVFVKRDADGPSSKITRLQDLE